MRPTIFRNLLIVSVTVAGAFAAMAACGGGSSTTDASTCSSPLTQCGGTCSDLQSDPANCGACGKACDTQNAQVCSQGTCALACGGGTTQCGSSCFDTKVDPNNCGACGNKCADGESCSGGKCGVACAASLTLCGDGGGVCVDTQSDNENCGACGNACAPNQSCAAGTCAGNLVDAGPTDVTGNLTNCTTGAAQVEHMAAMTDGRALAIGMICSGTGYVVTSSNGGLSWSAPISTAMANVQDFTIAAAHGAKPILYAAATDSSNELLYATSADGGATWSAPVVIDTAVFGSAGLRVDSYKDTVYISEHAAGAGALHIVRNGAGAGDAGPMDAGDAGFGVTSVSLGYAYGDVMVDQSNGDIWFSSDNPSFQLVKSTNGGATFGAVQTAPGQLFYSDWILANGTIYGTGLTGGTPAGGVYALPVASLTTPKFVSLDYSGTPQQYSVTADSAGDVFSAAQTTTGVAVMKVPFGTGEAVDDAGVIADGGPDAGAAVTTATVVTTTGATGPQIATRTNNAAVYAYTLAGRIFAGVKAF